MAVLRDDCDAEVLVDGDDRDRTGMLEVLAYHRVPVRRRHLVGDEPHQASPYLIHAAGRPREAYVVQLVGSEFGARQAHSSASGSRPACFRRKAASTRPLNSGCGFVGRDFSSG